MGNRVLEFLITARDRTAAGLTQAARAFQGLRARVSSVLSGMAAKLMAFAGITVGVVGALRLFRTAIAAAFEIERYQAQFKLLLGSMDAAKQRMNDLRDLAQGTFSFSELAEASRTLTILTRGAMGSKASLELIQDAAQGTGASLSEMAQSVGRAFAGIVAGGEISRVLTQLEITGALSMDAGQKLREMERAGASASEMWAVLEKDLRRYAGSVDEVAKTGGALFGTMQENWKLALGEFAAAFTDLAKDKIQALNDKLKELREDGSIAVWAQNAKEALELVGKALETLQRGSTWLKAFGAFAGTAQAHLAHNKEGGRFNPLDNIRAAWRTLRGGGINDALTNAADVLESGLTNREQATKERGALAAQVEAKGTVGEEHLRAKALAEADQKKLQAYDELRAKELAEQEAADQKWLAERKRQQAENAREIAAMEKAIAEAELEAKLRIAREGAEKQEQALEDLAKDADKRTALRDETKAERIARKSIEHRGQLDTDRLTRIQERADRGARLGPYERKLLKAAKDQKARAAAEDATKKARDAAAAAARELEEFQRREQLEELTQIRKKLQQLLQLK